MAIVYRPFYNYFWEIISSVGRKSLTPNYIILSPKIQLVLGTIEFSILFHTKHWNQDTLSHKSSLKNQYTITLLFFGNAKAQIIYATSPTPVNIVVNKNIILTITGSISKYSAIPPHTP